MSPGLFVPPEATKTKKITWCCNDYRSLDLTQGNGLGDTSGGAHDSYEKLVTSLCAGERTYTVHMTCSKGSPTTGIG